MTRTAAAAIDFGIVIIALGSATSASAHSSSCSTRVASSAPAVSPAVMYTAGGLLLTVYLAVSWRGSGRTYGNTSWGCASSTTRGQRLHPVVSFVRAAFYVIFPIGLLWVLVSAETARCKISSCVPRDLRLGRAGAARSGTDSDLTPRHAGASADLSASVVVIATTHADKSVSEPSFALEDDKENRGEDDDDHRGGDESPVAAKPG